MNRMILMLVLVVVGWVGSVSAAPFVGQVVTYKEDSTHSYLATVTHVIDADEADLLLVGYGTLWYAQTVTYTTGGSPVVYLEDVTRGPGNDQWLESTDVYVGSRVTAQSSPSLTLNGGGTQFSTTEDTEYSVTVRIDLTTSLVAGMGGTVHLLCDGNATPTTEISTLQFAHGLGLAQTASFTGTLRWRTAIGEFCRVTTTNDTGTPTFTLVRQRLQILD